MKELQLVECPRDAMQGIKEFIPTEIKAQYMNQLLKVGFHTLDFGSFVSPKAIPQLRDTAKIYDLLDLDQTATELLSIVANTRGAESAAQFEKIKYLGFPFSISDTFQSRNINSSIADSYNRLLAISEIAAKNDKEVVTYISMGFGNPYGDPWNAEIVIEWCEKIYRETGCKIISLSDTIGVATKQVIGYLFTYLIPALPQVTIGAHFHSTPSTWLEKVESAYEAGCRRFDGALKGYGGCPMAKDDLTGNMPMENIVSYLRSIDVETGIQEKELNKSLIAANSVFI